MAVSGLPNIFYPQHANIYLKHIAKEILRMKCLDIDEKLDKGDLALVKNIFEALFQGNSKNEMFRHR